jgi:hypothetical protein
MLDEITVSVNMYGCEYSAHLNTNSRTVQVYGTNGLHAKGIWSSNAICNLIDYPNDSMYDHVREELTKALVEYMYV